MVFLLLKCNLKLIVKSPSIKIKIEPSNPIIQEEAKH